MFLKKLEMENFKSFGKKTVIEFKKGFTGVSGPNGSGKSNISDAILFVLGPKSSKVLRAQKLTDLIFNGGKDKNPADYCKVSLVFDNSDREIPLDADEVTFTRMVKRGEGDEDYNSYFYINGERAKLQDFTNLLSKAKIFADGYNIVQQGDITRIVEMSPLERRRILEEISGITKYDEEINRAQMKRKETEDNMEKIRIIMDEISARLNSLENEKNTALRYLELKNDLLRAKAQMEYRKMKQIKSEIDGDQAEMVKINNEIMEIEKEIEKERNELEEMKINLEKINQDIKNQGGEEQLKIKAQIDDLNISLGKNKVKLEDLETRMKEIEVEMKNLNGEEKSLRGTIREKEENYKKIRDKLNDVFSNLNARKDELKKLEDKISRSSSEVKDLQKYLNEKQVEYNSLKDELSSLNSKLSAKEEALKNLNENIANIEEEIKNVELNIKDADWRIENSREKEGEIKKRLKDLNDLYYSLKNRENSIRDELNRINERIAVVSRNYEKNKGRLEASKNYEAIYAIMEQRDKGTIRGIHGTVRELIEIPQGLELAVEIAGGNRLDSIVVENDEVAAQCVEYLKSTKRGTATFLPLNKMIGGRPRGKALLAIQDPKSLGLVIELLKYDKRIENALWFVFSDTVIVEDLNTARKLMGGVRLVTRDGQLIEASGAITGGHVVRSEKQVVISDIENLGKELRELNEKKNELEEEYRVVTKRLDEITKQIQEISSQKTESPEIWIKVRNENAERFKKLNEILKIKKDERDKIEKEIEYLRENISQLQEKITFVEKDMENVKIRISEFASEKDQEKMRSLKNEIQNMESDYNALTLLLKDMEHELNDLKKSLDSLIKTKERLTNEMKMKNEEAEEIRKKIDELSINLRKFQEINASIEESIKKKWEERENVQRKISEIEMLIQKNEEEIKRKNDFIITLKTRIFNNTQEYEESEREYRSYGIEVTEPVPGFSELKRTIEYCESTMRSLEPVNMKSIEDYNNEKSRLEDLRKDYNELSKERQELLNLENELNKKKKEGLLTVYRSIRENFSRIYAEITNGGEAVMYLENEDDPFAGGLIIKARPNGKKMIRLEALSGGEKSLTALTFILAIQQYDPSPFYLFDESDMFLDGFNAENVARILKANSDKAQFIVVSLRRAVLKYADHIIGVTITNDGISKIYEETFSKEADAIGS